MHSSIPRNVQNSVSTCISVMASASQQDQDLKRAVKMGQIEPNGLMLRGYTVGYGGVDLLTLELCEHGLGLFTLTPIPANQIIIAGRGQLQKRAVHQTSEQQKYTWEPSPPGLFVFSQFEEQDANIMRYVNSSRGYGDVPNAVLEWRAGLKMPFLRARTDIVPDATGRMQILVDYHVGV